MINGSLKLAFLCNDSLKWAVFILERKKIWYLKHKTVLQEEAA